MFLLLLTEEDYAARGQAVAHALVEAAPQEWLGYRYHGLTPNIEVSSIDRYLEHWLGFARPPARWQGWLDGTPSGVRRQDPLALQIAQGRFIEAALRLCLLLEGDYTPYWKWLAFAFSKCRNASSLGLKERGKLVREMCAAIHEMLKAAGLASQDLRAHPHPLFCDHAALRQHIEDEQTITGK